MTARFQLTGNRPLDLRKLRIPRALRVLVLAPHPDDFDAISVTMRVLQQNGNAIAVHVLTSGASGVQAGFPGANSAAAKAALREAEQAASCKLFGLPPAALHFARLDEDSSGEMKEDEGNRKAIRDILAKSMPGIVFMPHFNDTNAGHQRTYALTRACIEEGRCSLTLCLNRDPKTIALRTDMYTDFGQEEAEWKGRLLRAHVTQHQRNIDTRGKGFDDRILECNRKAAQDAALALPFAEVFEVESCIDGAIASLQ